MIRGESEEYGKFGRKEEDAGSIYSCLRVKMVFGIEYTERNLIAHKHCAKICLTLSQSYFNEKLYTRSILILISIVTGSWSETQTLFSNNSKMNI